MPFDKVPVDPRVFSEVVYKSYDVKMENQSDADYRAGKDKQQKLTKEGVPVWSLKLNAVMPPSGSNFRENESEIRVSWVSHQPPNEVFERWKPVELVNPQFGVTGVKRRDGSESYAVYWTAEDVRPVADSGGKFKAVS